MNTEEAKDDDYDKVDTANGDRRDREYNHEQSMLKECCTYLIFNRTYVLHYRLINSNFPAYFKTPKDLS